LADDKEEWANPQDWKRGAAAAYAGGMGALISAFSRAADLAPLPTEYDLFVFLNRRLAYAKNAQRRESWVGGRLYNRLCGEDPHFVSLSGVHFTQTLKTIDVDHPAGLVAGDFYRLSVERVQAAVDLLRERLTEK